MSIYEDTFESDFSEEMNDTILIQSFVRNDGYKDIFGEGASYPCHVQYEIFNITKSDGTLTPTTMQVFLAGDVAITARDRITVNGVSPKVLRISPDPDSYGQVIMT